MEVGSGMGGPGNMQHIGNSSTYVTQKQKQKMKNKQAFGMGKKYAGAKKFPELKMVVNGDYRSSNYTMSSDDEVFNVSKNI